MRKKNTYEKTQTKESKASKQSTKKSGIATSVNSAAILDILERFSGYVKNGETVKLKIESSQGGADDRLGIKELLRNQYGISLGTEAIKSNLTELVALIDRVKCTEKEDSDSESDNSYKVDHYWIEKTNILDCGEYKIIKAKIESDNSLSNDEKANIIRKIDSISSSDYSKELGSLDNTPTSDLSWLGNKNLMTSLSIINKARESNLKISFRLNIHNVNAQLCELDRDIVFSPYGITDVKGRMYMFGLEDGETCLTHFRIDTLSKIRILKQTVDSRDKNGRLQRYLDAHPFMSRSKKLIRATLKINKSDDVRDDILGEVFELFGGTVKIREESDKYSAEEYYLVDNLVTTDEDIITFALMHADRVELLSDRTDLNSLRGVLRRTGSSLAEKYLKTPEDKYLSEVDRCSGFGELSRLNRRFYAPGIDLSNRKEHHGLDLIELRLFHNNVSDLSFVKNYKHLAVFKSTGNKVSDYSALSHIESLQEISLEKARTKDLNFIKECRSLRKLVLRSVNIDDFSALYSPLRLDYLVLNNVQGIDVEAVRRGNPLTEIIVTDKNTKDKSHINPIYPIHRRYEAEYPLNMIREFFEVDQKHIFDIEYSDTVKIDAAVLADDKIRLLADEEIERLEESERKVLVAVMKEHLSVYEAAVKLGIRTGVCINLFETARARFIALKGDGEDFYNQATKGYFSKILNRSPKNINVSNRGVAAKKAAFKRSVYCSDDIININEE